MEGPHNGHGWEGFDAIPAKDQPEAVFGGPKYSAWTEDWEAPFGAAYSLTSALFGANPPPFNNNLDMARWGRETMHPRNYVNAPYMELWLRAMARWVDRSDGAPIPLPPPAPAGASAQPITRDDLVSLGIIDAESLERAAMIEQRAKTQAVPGFGAPNENGDYSSPHYTEGRTEVPVARRFVVGQKVRAVLQWGAGHSREYPPYRGRIGTVVADYGIAAEEWGPSGIVFQPYYQKPYPDIECRGQQTFMVPVYSVRFEAKDIWGEGYAEPGLALYADMWEPYLEAAE
jgi:hypothetical protein